MRVPLCANSLSSIYCVLLLPSIILSLVLEHRVVKIVYTSEKMGSGEQRMGVGYERDGVKNKRTKRNETKEPK